MAKYTDDDVERLALAVEQALHFGLKAPGSPQALKKALAPFLPSPEEQLIEKMAREIHEYDEAGYTSRSWDDWQDHYRTIAKLALDVVNREGLPNG